MHLKVLLTAGAATASLLAGTAGTALLGHAATAPAKHHTVVHHVSNPNHPGGAKGNTGTHTHNTGTHKHKNTGTNGKPKPKHSKPKSTPTPTPHP
jgi:hypothetical protein